MWNRLELLWYHTWYIQIRSIYFISRSHRFCLVILNWPVLGKVTVTLHWSIHACINHKGALKWGLINKSHFSYITNYFQIEEIILYQTRETVFNYISKHQEESWKYSIQQSICDELQCVRGNVVRHCLIKVRYPNNSTVVQQNCWLLITFGTHKL